MKAFHVFFFILATILLLILLSICIPNGKIQIGSITLKFPTVEQVLSSDQDESTTEITTPDKLAEDKIRANLQQQQLSKREQLAYKIANASGSICVPNDSIDYFNSFFSALEHAKQTPIRILHIGDSQIEEDRISGFLRENFQSTYGGNGPGLIPAIQTVFSTSIQQRCSAELQRYMIYGPTNYRHQERLYGVMGQMAHLNGQATWTFSSPNLQRTRPGTKHYSQITFMVGQPQSRVSFVGQRNEYQTDTFYLDTTQQALSFVTLPLQGSGAQATVQVEGEANIYGIMLDGTNGVSLDNVPMRGSAGTVFTSINASTLTPYFTKYNVPLIILQFGGNTVPYLKGVKSITYYCDGIARQLNYLKKISPNSTLLFIGPSDMATNIEGQIRSYPELERIVSALRDCCLKNNVAYWDLYTAMGGNGSMVKWTNQNPPLAGSDYVHFTPRGADKAAEMLYESLMDYHAYYTEKDSL